MNGNEGDEAVSKKMKEECEETVVYMCGYLPGSVPEKAPILSPSVVRISCDSWKDVCGGGCGFAMAISGSGKLITWGSADDESQSYLTSGMHGGTPEPYPLPTETPVAKAAAGWAHCVLGTEDGEVYTWGWKECVPSGKIIHGFGKQNSSQNEQATPQSEASNVTTGTALHLENKKDGEENVKRRRISSARQDPSSSTSIEENFAVSPRIVTLGPGVKITAVAAGGRHTLVLSDMGQVWGWGYGGEGQLGLGSRIKMVSSPHLIPCIETRANGKDRSSVVKESASSSAQVSKDPGSYVKGIACGGRHSAVITDAGVLFTFGWGMYGQCGQGSTDDQLKPAAVSSLLGIDVKGVAAGLWHTLCVSVEGRVYAFGGNQFGQLGTGADQAETSPRLLDAPNLESKQAKIVSCGARHSAILTDDGQVFSWGWNKYGQLGLGDSLDRNIPYQVAPIEGFLPANIACGWWHTLLLGEKCL